MRPASDQGLALIGEATAVIARATDHENHPVAAAIRSRDGRVVTGINLDHFTGGPCAELVALANAAAEELDVATIVAVGADGRGVIQPCGRCRQVILDYWPDANVLMPAGPGDGPTSVPIADLLPGAYAVPSESQN